MSNTRSIGRLFVCIASQAAGSPLVDDCMVTERWAPHRIGDGKLIRLPFTGKRPTRGLVVGVWRPPAVHPDALRYQWLTEDHRNPFTRRRVREILTRMPVMSRSAANAAIDEARKRFAALDLDPETTLPPTLATMAPSHPGKKAKP